MPSALGIIYKLGPGVPGWVESPNDIPQHPSPPIGKTFDYTLHSFPGGDGSTVLVGRLFRPLPPGIDKDEKDPKSEENDVTVTSSHDKPPIVVMALGLGFPQDCKIDGFVQAFRLAGFAVFTFDYATFGWSHGWPRHQVIPDRHVKDLQAAIHYVRSAGALATQVDTQRIALWGTSLGGGHVLRVAAVDPAIRAVVANVPHIKSGLEGIVGTLRNDPINGTLGLLKVTAALIERIMTVAVGWITNQDGSIYIPLHGLPGSAALMQNQGDDNGYGSLMQDLPEGLNWKNLVSVRSVVPILLYRPYNSVASITSPTLFVAAELDTLCPASDSVKATKLMNSNTTKRVVMKDLGHFDGYQGQGLEKVLAETIPFLKEQLAAKN